MRGTVFVLLCSSGSGAGPTGCARGYCKSGKPEAVPRLSVRVNELSRLLSKYVMSPPGSRVVGVGVWCRLIDTALKLPRRRGHYRGANLTLRLVRHVPYEM